MSFTNSFSYVIITFFLATLTLTPCSEATHVEWTQWHNVHIVNGFYSNDKPLNIHCKSKDDDLGDHSLWNGQESRFHFGLNFWHSTLFSCDMTWGTQQKHINVFDTPAETPLACMENEECFWLVTEDGFFISTDNKNWIRQLDW